MRGQTFSDYSEHDIPLDLAKVVLDAPEVPHAAHAKDLLLEGVARPNTTYA